MSSTISIGKYGNFNTNHVIGRPYYITFELLDESQNPLKSALRIVPASELYADINDDGSTTPSQTSNDSTAESKNGAEYEVVAEDGEVVLRTNRAIMDDSSSQTMTMAEIEALKAKGTGSGKDLIKKILDSHLALDQKTAFALAKYTLRKTKKYLKRFTIVPLDVSVVANWMLSDKDPGKIMDIREETLALLGSLSNVHCTTSDSNSNDEGAGDGRGRWLVIDETSGLLVASMAEKMGLLNPVDPPQAHDDYQKASDNEDGRPENENGTFPSTRPPRIHKTSNLAKTNTVTVLHVNSQPNLALLRYFDFDHASPPPSHPLSQHFRSLSWLQLLSAEDDPAYIEPETFPDEVIRTWKGGRRGNYYRKRRRWEKTRSTVDETRAGGFDGLIIASLMDLTDILQHTVPLLRGGAQVVIYSPTIETLAELADCYSSARRTAFVSDPPKPGSMPTEDFPLDPTLLLAATIHTVRCRPWQVLPGRTHPLMTGRGGSEGYIFTATRVIPAEGKIEARGQFRKRKLNDSISRKESEIPEQGVDHVDRGSETAENILAS